MVTKAMERKPSTRNKEKRAGAWTTTTTTTGKGKQHNQPAGEGNPFKGQQGYGKGKGCSIKRKSKGYCNTCLGGKGAEGKRATNICYRWGQPGRMARQCRAAIHNCDTGNFNTNDQTDDWYSKARYDQGETDAAAGAATNRRSKTTTHLIARRTIAMIGALTEWVSLITEPSAWNKATTENSDQPTCQALRAQLGLNDKPRWTTDCHTLLRLWGFQLTLHNHPQQHNKGFNRALENRDGLLFLQADITALPKGTKLQSNKDRFAR